MSKKRFSTWIGFDPREAAAFAVARQSVRFYSKTCPINGVVLSDLQKRGLYYRPTERRLGRLWDVISEAPMSTEFAISRFLVPTLEWQDRAQWDEQGWAIFMDCDVLVRDNLGKMVMELDDSYPLYCVKHNHVPQLMPKMDNQVQTAYPRKNWSSVMAINLDHPSNEVLTVDKVNTWPGRDLHALKWLKDEEIGELSPEWNYLVNHTKLTHDVEPKIVHFTEGGPWLDAFREVEYAQEWFTELERWAA